MYSLCTSEYRHAPHVSPGLSTQSQPNARVAAAPVAVALRKSIGPLPQTGCAKSSVEPSSRECSSIPARPRSTRRQPTQHAVDGCTRRAQRHLGKQVRSGAHRGEGRRCLRERTRGRTRCGGLPWRGGTPRGLNHSVRNSRKRTKPGECDFSDVTAASAARQHTVEWKLAYGPGRAAPSRSAVHRSSSIL